MGVDGMGRALTRHELHEIRNSACGRCGSTPPLPDGSRCHPHRIVPGSEGGQYVEGNVVPRCPSCHDLEHGGDGTAPFIGAAQEGGRKGAFALHDKYPDLARATARRLHQVYPNLARDTAIRTHQRHPELGRELGRKHGPKGGANSFGKDHERARAAARRCHELHPDLARDLGRKYGPVTVARRLAAGLDAFGLTHEQSVEAGHKGGLVGGHRVHELHPDLMRENGRRVGHLIHELYPDLAQRSGRLGGLASQSKRSPAERSALGRKAGLASQASRTPAQRIESSRKAALARWAAAKAEKG